MVRPTFPAEQSAESCVITHHVKMSETVYAAPYVCEKSQYKLKRIIATVGVLDRNAALSKMFGEMAFLEHLEKQGEPSKWSCFLIYKLKVTIWYIIL